VLDDDDHPGLLSEVLQSFASRQINLTNIISCPTRKQFGKYHFFIELEGSKSDVSVAEALKEISQTNKVKVLGSYKSVKI
jgi:prephenate dehydratase